MRRVEIKVGWTKHDLPRDQIAYAPFWDTYIHGQRQHVETIDVKVSCSLTDQQIAELVFVATNSPELLTGDAERVKAAILATGYRGREAHYSLSVGDTVTVAGDLYAVARSGWVQMPNVLQFEEGA
jgi:hypothetical protein